MPVSQRERELHSLLITKLQQTFHDSEKFKALKLAARSYLREGVRGKCHDMKDLVNQLEANGTIKIGDYSKLKKMIKDAGCNADEILDEIEETEKEIRKAGLEASPNAKPYSQQDTPNRLANEQFDSKATTAGASAHSAVENVQRVDKPSPGTLAKVGYKKGSGFCLIINIFVEERIGTKDDAEGLKAFLESVNCKVVIKEDLSLKEFNDRLDECQQLLKNSMVEYSYFICVILSHGDKDGICTFDDGRIKMEDIMDKFKNDKMPAFVDRPKLFFVQAYRGEESQAGHDRADDEPGTSHTDTSDIIQKAQVPTDADVLLACATTPGYKAWRRAHIGSWFIYELTCLLKDHYKTEHLEEILISLRHVVASNYQTSKGAKEMPCTSSTLTKRFYF